MDVAITQDSRDATNLDTSNTTIGTPTSTAKIETKTSSSLLEVPGFVSTAAGRSTRMIIETSSYLTTPCTSPPNGRQHDYNYNDKHGQVPNAAALAAADDILEKCRVGQIGILQGSSSCCYGEAAKLAGLARAGETCPCGTAEGGSKPGQAGEVENGTDERSWSWDRERLKRQRTEEWLNCGMPREV